MTRRWTLVSGAILGGVAVMSGAFGAHMLKDLLTPHYLAVFETAVRYQMYHALALCVAGIAMDKACSPFLGKAAWGFLIGVLLFSGSLYGVALLELRWMGVLTPLGGISFIFGWVCLIMAFTSATRPV